MPIYILIGEIKINTLPEFLCFYFLTKFYLNKSKNDFKLFQSRKKKLEISNQIFSLRYYFGYLIYFWLVRRNIQSEMMCANVKSPCGYRMSSISIRDFH